MRQDLIGEQGIPLVDRHRFQRVRPQPEEGKSCGLHQRVLHRIAPGRFRRVMMSTIQFESSDRIPFVRDDQNGIQATKPCIPECLCVDCTESSQIGNLVKRVIGQGKQPRKPKGEGTQKGSLLLTTKDGTANSLCIGILDIAKQHLHDLHHPAHLHPPAHLQCGVRIGGSTTPYSVSLKSGFRADIRRLPSSRLFESTESSNPLRLISTKPAILSIFSAVSKSYAYRCSAPCRKW